MEYTLCLKIKNAGFPQRPKELGGLYILPEQEPWFRTNGFNGSEGCLPVPSLRELIDACGDEFGNLSLKRGVWLAEPEYSISMSIDNGVGDEPEEAVANLWLALHETISDEN